MVFELKLKLNQEVVDRVAWGRPDSPVRHLCALCHGALPEVPLLLFSEDGHGAAFCDECADKIIVVVEP